MKDAMAAFAELDVARLPFRRDLTHDELRKVHAAISLAFETNLPRDVVEKVMHYCHYVERQMTGRAAGHIEDLIVRYFIRYFSALRADDDIEHHHMEIGALFGAATIYSCHATRMAGSKVRTVVIDPFAGYYDQGVDIVTKLAVTWKTFFSNIDLFGFRESVTVFGGFSSDQDVIDDCKDYRLLSLLIDGDHSYEGVRQDWLNYSRLVVPGGYVLFDDYNNPTWPDVTACVNQQVLPYMAGLWDVALVFSNSLVLKRTGVAAHGRAEADRLTASIGEKQHEIGRLRAELETTQGELTRKMNYISRLKSSASWRLTAPLRIVRALRDDDV